MLVSNFADRLNMAIKIKDIKPAEIVRRSELLFELGKINKPLNKPSITNYLNGVYEAKQDNIYALSLILDVDEGWLMGLDVPMEKKEDSKESSNAFPTSDIPIKFPVLGKISAGLPVLAQENIEGYEFAPSTFIKEDFEYFYLKVSGDSMNLKFPEGNLVLVQKQPTLENGEIGVILVGDNEATVKKYRCENDLVILEPMSTNPEHTVQIYNPQNVNIQIIGKVILHLGKV